MSSTTAKILVIDNYDSFTYNLVFLLKELNANVEIYRNDKINLEQASKYDKILLSPGPGLPADSGIMPQIIAQLASQKSILGVCLGHQAIGESFGAKLINLTEVYHGVATPIYLKSDAKDPIFEGLPDGFDACRYHSWAVSTQDFPDTVLQITAQDDQGCIMALSHRQYDLKGVQFHPESILTPLGRQIIYNWLKS